MLSYMSSVPEIVTAEMQTSSQLEVAQKDKLRTVNFREIMSDYAPKWLAVVGFVASVACSV